MKENRDLVQGLLKKAASDTVALKATRVAGAFDAACFHAQQAAEKYLKAYLTHRGIQFPHTHNLGKLVELCAGDDPSFRELVEVVTPLTPYAVELRYDEEFWPTPDDAGSAFDAVTRVRDFTLARVDDSLLRRGSEES